MKKLYSLTMSILLLFSSCNDEDNGKDATGVFEATEVIVSAEATGKLLAFEAYEGMQLKKNLVLGQIDTIQLSLKKMHWTNRYNSIVFKKNATFCQSVGLRG